jgi:hypothetical protein
MAHARLGPSNHRWLHCPGSVREEAAYPNISGEAAIDGTGSHLLLELCLKNGVRADWYLGHNIGAGDPERPNGWQVRKDRCERVQVCLDYLSQRHAELLQAYPGCKVIIESESRSDPGGTFGRTDWWGTVDITITVLNASGGCEYLEVVDYKDGQGYVSEKNNSQLLSYMFGKLRPFIASGPSMVSPLKPTVPCVAMTIVQPKTKQMTRRWTVSSADVIDWAENVAYWAARATDDPNAPLKAGEWCKWCLHGRAGKCEEKSKGAIRTMSNLIATDGGSIFDVIQNAALNVRELSLDKLSEIADAKAPLDALFKSIMDEIEFRIDRGEIVPGYAKVPGRSTRKWNTSEKELVSAVCTVYGVDHTKLYKTDLVSPSQFEKLDLPKDVIEKVKNEFVTTVAGSLSVSRVLRESQRPSVDEMFSNISNESVAQPLNNVLQSNPTTQAPSFD